MEYLTIKFSPSFVTIEILIRTQINCIGFGSIEVIDLDEICFLGIKHLSAGI